VAQGEGLEFKPQYLNKPKKKNNLSRDGGDFRQIFYLKIVITRTTLTKSQADMMNRTRKDGGRKAPTRRTY
jgi:hypothetical protein